MHRLTESKTLLKKEQQSESYVTKLCISQNGVHTKYMQYYDHSAYSWNIKCQKCVGIGLNGFIF